MDIDQHDSLKLSSSSLNILHAFMKNKQDFNVVYLKCKSEEKEGVSAESVFTIDLIPGFVFKQMNNPENLFSRYRNHISALQVVKSNKFDLIVIPNVGIVEEYNLLVEEKLDIDPYHYIQEYYYRIYANKMRNSIRQLTNFLFYIH
jgi:hypothetical protein